MRNTIVGMSLVTAVAATTTGCSDVEGSPRPDSSPFANAVCKQIPEALSKEGDRGEIVPLVGGAVLDCVTQTHGKVNRSQAKAEVRTEIKGEKGTVLFLAKSAFQGGFSPAETQWVSFMSNTAEGTHSVELSLVTMSMSAKNRVLITNGEVVSLYESSRHLMSSKDRDTIKCAEELIIENGIKISSVNSDASNIATFDVPTTLTSDCNTANKS